MNINILKISLALISSVALAGCLRDEIQPCPPLKARVQIMDRHYEKEIVTKADDFAFGDDDFNENTPFKDIVPTLYYVLHDVATGEVVFEYANHAIDSDDNSLEQLIDFPEDIPYGKYVLTVWGGLDDDDQLIDDKTILDLSTVTNTVYVATDTIDFNVKHTDYDLNMRRVNGKVMVETVWLSMPQHLDATEMSFTGLASTVNSKLEYSKIETSNDSQLAWTPAESIINEIVLPPSAKGMCTCMNLRYINTENPETYELTMPEIYLNIKRNQISYLRYVVDPNKGTATAYIFVQGEWKEITNMGVD